MTSAPRVPAAPAGGDVTVGVGDEISYEELGVRLLHQVLHEERIEDSIAMVLGERIDLGPFGAGPGRLLAKVRAVGQIGRPQAERVPGDLVCFRVLVPVDVVFDLHLAGDQHRFHADVRIPLLLTARAAAPVTIVWDITPPTEEEIGIAVRVDKRRTAVLRRLAGIDHELRGFMCRFVTRELGKEHVRRATRLHLGEIIDAAWPLISGQFFRPEEGPAPSAGLRSPGRFGEPDVAGSRRGTEEGR
jgi:hypothetical protein